VKVASESFPKSARLLKHADFERVYRTGQRHFSSNMSVFFLRRVESQELKPNAGPRIGLTVGRALGGAVMRNRIRRRMRAAVRKQLAALRQPVDVVFNPRKSAAEVDFALLTNEIGQAFAAIAGPRNPSSRKAMNS
jgi:ribonuclease P protein component